MPRGKRKAESAKLTSAQAKIRDAERALNTGMRENVLIAESDLERVAVLIEKLGIPKQQVLRKAVRLGLDVLETNPVLVRASEKTSEELYGVGVTVSANAPVVVGTMLGSSSQLAAELLPATDVLGAALAGGWKPGMRQLLPGEEPLPGLLPAEDEAEEVRADDVDA